MRQLFISKLQVNEQEYEYCDLNKVADYFHADLKKIPYSVRVVLENVVRNAKS